MSLEHRQEILKRKKANFKKHTKRITMSKLKRSKINSSYLSGKGQIGVEKSIGSKK